MAVGKLVTEIQNKGKVGLARCNHTGGCQEMTTLRAGSVQDEKVFGNGSLESLTRNGQYANTVS